LAASVTKCEQGTRFGFRAETIGSRTESGSKPEIHRRHSPPAAAKASPASARAGIPQTGYPLFLNLLAERPSREDIECGTTDTFAISSAFSTKNTMTNEDERELQTELARLQQEHRDLDAAIDALHQSPAPDLLRLQRLKKRKLQLRDRIAFIEDQITPDIIA
jgi:hypothetical protein